MAARDWSKVDWTNNEDNNLIREFLADSDNIMNCNQCECLDSTGILHERDKPDPGQWSGTSCLQQRRIISDSQRHLSRQGLWRNLQLFIFFHHALAQKAV